MKSYLLTMLEKYLEEMCMYHTTQERDLFYYKAGQADAILKALEDEYDWTIEYATEHVRNMNDIKEEQC